MYQWSALRSKPGCLDSFSRSRTHRLPERNRGPPGGRGAALIRARRVRDHQDASGHTPRVGGDCIGARKHPGCVSALHHTLD